MNTAPGLADLAIAWHDRAARDLPWRRAGTSAWAVLVSEVMLQQTPVVRVTPVFEEWMRRWPTPSVLATEPAGAAIRAWGRLGYPRRALRLHESAVAVTTHHSGRVPADVASLEALPGIGTYTARAVAAFAFGQRQPVVDTNVRRLVARVHRGAAHGGTATSARDLATVEALLPASPARAVRASAALMELGALICTARTPDCDSCPLPPLCRWRRAGRPMMQPPRRSPGYLGTTRQARGVLLELVRRNSAVDRGALSSAWPDAPQCERALAGLIEDGLLVEVGLDRYGLPGADFLR